MLLPLAGSLAEADARLAPRLDAATVEGIVGRVPEPWLAPQAPAAYADYLCRRLAPPRGFAAEAEEARRARA